MQEVEKGKILELWKQGFGSSRIAKPLGLNTNTVKTFCRRNGLTGDRTHIPTLKKGKETEKSRRKNCVFFIIQKPGEYSGRFWTAIPVTQYRKSGFADTAVPVDRYRDSG